MAHVDIDSVHSYIMKQIIDKKVMAPLLKPHKHFHYYPVVIGGVNVVRCAKKSPKALELIGNIYKNDIDVKFIADDSHVEQGHDERMYFLNKLVRSRGFKKILTKASTKLKTAKLTITPFIIDQRQHKIEGIRLSMRVILQLEYKITNVPEEVIRKKVLLDTGVYNTLAFNKTFQKLFNTSLPIPYDTYKGIPVASCAWTYFDTVRMLIESAEHYNTAIKEKENVQFYFTKYMKYLAKFAVLYITVKQISNTPEYEQLRDLYNISQQSISKIDVKKETNTNQITEEQKQTLNILVNLVRKKTNLNSIKFLIKNASPLKST